MSNTAFIIAMCAVGAAGLYEAWSIRWSLAKKQVLKFLTNQESLIVERLLNRCAYTFETTTITYEGFVKDLESFEGMAASARNVLVHYAYVRGYPGLDGWEQLIQRNKDILEPFMCEKAPDAARIIFGSAKAVKQ